MKRTERTVIYAALIALASINLVLLLGHSGRAAFADAAAFLADTLGPAESVTLVDGDKNLVLRNTDKRLAWGDGDFRKTYAVAFVDISKALNPLMDSSSFAEERDALRKELEPQDKDFRARMAEIRAKGEKITDPQGPEGQELRGQFLALNKEYTEWQQTAVTRSSELEVKQLQTAYRELATAVNVVADRMNIDIVLRFIPPDQDFKSKDGAGALDEIRLRTAVKIPEKLDITSEVLEELSLQDKG